MNNRDEPDRFMVSGTASRDYEDVRAEFKKNFSHRGELGAACAIYHRGNKVVDLWGGYRDVQERKPWLEDTLVLVFSTTKGIAAMAMAVAHSQGLFELDETIATYWPEFAQAGKEEITVRQLFAHQAGLAIIDEQLNAERLADLDHTAEIIARQKPNWQPGLKHGYHTISLGWYQNELIRRVDPQRRSLGTFFQDEVAKPLGIEFYIGLPHDVPDERVATIKGFHRLQMLLHLHSLPTGMVLSGAWPWTLTARTIKNPKFRRADEIGGPEYRRVEMPSANGIGQVRSIAKAYSEFAIGGAGLNLSANTTAELFAPAVDPPHGSRDVILKVDASYSFGFIRPSGGFPFGTTKSAFGCPGAGGSFAFADPDRQLGFAYAGNKMGFHLFDDPREKALRDACYRCLDRIEQSERRRVA